MRFEWIRDGVLSCDPADARGRAGLADADRLLEADWSPELVGLIRRYLRRPTDLGSEPVERATESSQQERPPR